MVVQRHLEPARPVAAAHGVEAAAGGAAAADRGSSTVTYRCSLRCLCVCVCVSGWFEGKESNE